MTQWDQMKKEIEREFANHRANFLQQKMISRTVHPRIDGLAEKYYNAIEWNEELLSKGRDSKVGSPKIWKQGFSLNNLQNIFYLQTMKKVFSNVDFDYVTDVGGGYGGMCRLMRVLGYEGEYDIIDFDIMHKMQKYFLESNEITDTRFKKLADKSFSPSGNSLLLATFSMNEMPLTDRSVIEHNIYEYDKFFIAHNKRFDNIDNIEYFKEFADILSDDYKITTYSCSVYSSCHFVTGEKNV